MAVEQSEYNTEPTYQADYVQSVGDVTAHIGDERVPIWMDGFNWAARAEAYRLPTRGDEAVAVRDGTIVARGTVSQTVRIGSEHAIEVRPRYP